MLWRLSFRDSIFQNLYAGHIKRETTLLASSLCLSKKQSEWIFLEQGTLMEISPDHMTYYPVKNFSWWLICFKCVVVQSFIKLENRLKWPFDLYTHFLFVVVCDISKWSLYKLYWFSLMFSLIIFDSLIFLELYIFYFLWYFHS